MRKMIRAQLRKQLVDTSFVDYYNIVMKKLWSKIKKRVYRLRAKHRLIRRYEYLNEVNNILEEYITSKILEGGSQEFITNGRQDLIKKQAEIRETTKMLEFLYGVK